MIKTGLEKFLSQDLKEYKGLRFGVLCNQASIDKNHLHIRDLLANQKKINISCFIGPQHGIRGEKQDNMVESEDSTDSLTGVPVFSLYGKSRKPTPAMLQKIDAFLIDLQDIGTRIYTFMYTMAYCLQAAKSHGKKVVVLDRPNPIGGIRIEGNVLDPRFSSFVGLYPMATRHGMTMGELALIFNNHFDIGCDLEVIKVQGWKRGQGARAWGRTWAPPSPNIPNFESALVFPGTVHFEGTNVSEGRGTTKPFEWIGAPFIESDKIAKEMNAKKIPGVYYRPIFFQPTYQKWKDHVCGGVHLHVTDEKKFESFRAGIELLAVIAQNYPKDFKWKEPPYEYEFERMPIDLIAGSDALREEINRSGTVKNFLQKAKSDEAGFKKLRKEFLVYS